MANITIGGGDHDVNVYGPGPDTVTQTTASSDTINLGNGNDTIFILGKATVLGAGANSVIGSASTFGSATIFGGVLAVNHLHGVTQDVALSGDMTLIGSSAATEFIGGSGTTVMTGNSGSDTFIGGSGNDTMSGLGGHNVFDFLTATEGGQHSILNFVSTDQLDVNGQSLNYLQSQNEVTVHDGNTYISADGGKTSIILVGVTDFRTAQTHNGG